MNEGSIPKSVTAKCPKARLTGEAKRHSLKRYYIARKPRPLAEELQMMKTVT